MDHIDATVISRFALGNDGEVSDLSQIHDRELRTSERSALGTDASFTSFSLPQH